MQHRDDFYPTRLRSRSAPIPRREPVLHGPEAARRDGPLTAEQLARFERDGFLVLEGFFDDREVRGFREEFRALQADPALRERPECILEHDSDAVRSLFAIHALSEAFATLAASPRLSDLARQILGSDVYVHQSRVNRKPAFRGRGFDWHSDFETWHAEDGMPAMRAVSASINLTVNHPQNGPLLLAPGSHRTFLPTVGATPDDYWKDSLRRQRQGVPDARDLAAVTAERGIVPALGGPGSVVLFDCNTLHASADNLSPDDRSNLFFVFNSTENATTAPFAAPRPRPAWVAAPPPADAGRRAA